MNILPERFVLIILAIFFQRQIFRVRNNHSLRREAINDIGYGLSKAEKAELYHGIEVVRQFQLLRAPKFTEIGSMAEHANAPYINRMIALDELREIDRQLEFINPDLARIAGESTYCYLSRIRRLALPGLSEKLVERIGFLAEHCRYRAEPFGITELGELRALIKDIVRMFSSDAKHLRKRNEYETQKNCKNCNLKPKRISFKSSRFMKRQHNCNDNECDLPLLNPDKRNEE
ncbi:unnamed protein product [Dracunculus medinensis]|uniref:DUF4158 domain-containing protein n=1 Tax=Dracunculus medinensis TaxID=318479 RepID=A0A0N4U622_DRAME|nr:unnamed protein product [Dracunculus medinensis]